MDSSAALGIEDVLFDTHYLCRSAGIDVKTSELTFPPPLQLKQFLQIALLRRLTIRTCFGFEPVYQSLVRLQPFSAHRRRVAEMC